VFTGKAQEGRALKRRFRHWIVDGHGGITIFLLGMVLVGWILSKDYGLSTDEWIHIDYARSTLGAYAGLGSSFQGPPDTSYYGPFFSVLAELGALLLAGFTNGLALIAARHFMYFLSLPLSVLGIYWLCLRLMNKPLALASAILFATQPLLFGHAFINPKDMPFMAFFILSIGCGLCAADRLKPSIAPFGVGGADNPISRAKPHRFWQPVWSNASQKERRLLVALPLITIVYAAEAYFLKNALRFLIDAVALAYGGQAWRPITALFRRVAQDAWKTPLVAYQARMIAVYSYGRLAIMGILTASMVLLILKLLRRTFPHSQLWQWLPTASAGILVGLTTAIRVAGPFAGVLVTVYYLRLGIRKALAAIAIYWGLAAGATYLAWPELWSAPVAHFVQAVRLMTAFPHASLELYRGQLIGSTALPWHFVPYLMLLQFTIPAIVLGFLGLIRSAASFVRGLGMRLEVVLLLTWIAAPVGAAIISRATLYSNFRQLLFATPPIFILAGVGLAWVMKMLKPPFAAGLLAAIAILPGVVGIVALHPYEYIYYNALAGGTGQASSAFETDYWCTSYREAIEHVNSVAPPGAVVGIHRLVGLAQPFARADLKLSAIFTEADVQKYSPNYLLVCARSDFIRRFMPGWSTVWSVDKAGAELAVIKVPAPSAEPPN
jgi:hypothetical protein